MVTEKRVVSFSDKIGRRGRRSVSLLVVEAEGQRVIVEFTGKTIPGVCRVLRWDYLKNGKWSHSTWQVELEQGVRAAGLSQDWETGRWTNELTWEGALEDFAKRLGVELPEWESAVERFVRACFPKVAAELDAEREARGRAPALPEVAARLAAAQEELARAQRERSELRTEIQALREAAQAEEEARRIRERNRIVREALRARGGRASLAELQELLAQLEG